MKALTFIEIDVPINTASPTTFRFSFPSSDQAPPFDSIPALNSVSVTPAVIAPGQNLGIRASVSVRIDDFLYPLEGSDYATGTFWGKMRAVFPDFEGLNLRVIRGEDDGTDISAMRTEHYVIEKMSRKRGVSIIAKDIIKLTDGKRAQAPTASTGRLDSGINDAVTIATLAPAGIGNSEYPASGKLNIGGEEIVSFTRSGDSLTLTRGVSGTDGVEHDADELCQLVLEYSSDDPDTIVADLLTYTDIDASWLDVNSGITRTYSAEIAEPTPVKVLLNELIEQVGLVIWWDAPDQRLRVRSLQTSTTAPILDTDLIMADSLSYREQYEKRISQSWCFFNPRSPLEDVDETETYKALAVTTQASDQEAVKKTLSRWIDSRANAVNMNDRFLSRYISPPRQFQFALFRDGVTVPELADLFRLQHFDLQDSNGDEELISVQITSVDEREDSYVCNADENTVFDFGDIEVTGTQTEIVLFDLAGGPTSATDATFVFNATVLRSTDSTTPSVRAGTWPAGSSITIILTNSADWQAQGGHGGAGGPSVFEGSIIAAPGSDGDDGGICYDAEGVDTDIYLGGTVDSYTSVGTLKAPGGGGGGQGGGGSGSTPDGGDGGGGAAGRDIGVGGSGGGTGGAGTDGVDGSDGDTAGNGGAGGGAGGGDGGDWGVAGTNGAAGTGTASQPGGSGGAAGKGIVKGGAVVNVYTDGNSGRFINGSGDTPDATT